MACASSIDDLKAWQDLIGALVSLAVGTAAIVISVRALKASQRQVDVAKAQLTFANEAETRRRLAHERAMRAALAPIVSGFCEWAEVAATALRDLPPAEQLTPKIRAAFRVPRPPLDLIAALVRLIEATDDEAVIARAAKLIGNTQIVSARLGLLKDRGLGLTSDNLDSYMADTLVIHAQATSMFDFARFKTNAGPPPLTWNEVAHGLDVLGLHGPRFATLYQRIQRLSTTSTDPEEL